MDQPPPGGFAVGEPNSLRDEWAPLDEPVPGEVSQALAG